MERLTEKTIGCFEYRLKDHKPIPEEFRTYDAFYDYSMAVRLLGKYEGTGMTPEEIKELERKYLDDEHEFCGEYGTDDCQFQHRLKTLQMECDKWRNDAIEATAKLGEIKIKMAELSEGKIMI
jgi:hypothetical protein